MESDSGISSDDVLAFAALGSRLFVTTGMGKSGDRIFAGGFSGGIFVSTDSGYTWTKADTAGRFPSLLSLDDVGQTLWAGTSNGVLCSTDEGVSWHQTGLTNASVNSIVELGGAMIAGTSGGIFVSADSGKIWLQTGFSMSPPWCLAADGNTLLEGTNRAIFRSSDDGGHWAQTSTGLPATTIHAIARSGKNLLAGTDGSGLYLSTDDGESWTHVLTQATDVYSLAVSDSDAFAGTWLSGVLRSTDFERSWSQADSETPRNAKVFALAVSGPRVYAGTYAGVFVSTDEGLTWRGENDSLTNTDVQSLLVNEDEIFAGTYNGGVFLHTSGGAGWQGKGVNGVVVYSLAAYGSDIFAGTGGGVFRSKDNGESWTEMPFTGQSSLVTSLLIFDSTLYASTGSGMLSYPLSGISTGVSARDGKIESFSLAQNYPNPFNPPTNIEFRISDW